MTIIGLIIEFFSFLFVRYRLCLFIGIHFRRMHWLHCNLFTNVQFRVNKLFKTERAAVYRFLLIEMIDRFGNC